MVNRINSLTNYIMYAINNKQVNMAPETERWMGFPSNMKKLLTILIILLAVCYPAISNCWITTGASYRCTSSIIPLHEILSGLVPDAPLTVELVKHTWPIDRNTIIPNYVTLKFTDGARLGWVSDSYFVTISGAIQNGPVQIFDTNLKVGLVNNNKINEIYPQWFGLKPTAKTLAERTQSSTAMQSCLNSVTINAYLNGGHPHHTIKTIVFPTDTYNFNKSLSCSGEAMKFLTMDFRQSTLYFHYEDGLHSDHAIIIGESADTGHTNNLVIKDLIISPSVYSVPTGAGIYLDGAANVVLRQNVIVNFKTGLILCGVIWSQVENNYIKHNLEDGILFTQGNRPICEVEIYRNHIELNGQHGVHLTANTMTFARSNTIFGNTGYGIWMEDGHCSKFQNNDIDSGQAGGIYIVDGDSLTVQNNWFSANSGPNMFFETLINSIVTGNKVYVSPGTIGIDIEYGEGNLVTDNQLIGVFDGVTEPVCITGYCIECLVESNMLRWCSPERIVVLQPWLARHRVQIKSIWGKK